MPVFPDSPHEAARQAALDSRMNARYYSKRLDRLRRYDMGLRLVTALTASAAIASFVSGVAGEHREFLSSLLAAVAALAAIVAPVARIPEQIEAHVGMLWRYTSHDRVFERLLAQGHAESYSERLVHELDRFQATHEIEAQMIQSRNDSLLRKCQEWTARQAGFGEVREAAAP